VLQASLLSMSDKLAALASELKASKDEVAFSVAGAIYKIEKMQVDVQILQHDSRVMATQGRELVEGVNEAVRLVR